MISLSLPYPASINNYYGRRRGGGVYIKEDGAKYRKHVIDYVAINKIPCFFKELSVKIILTVGDKRRKDIDNGLKCLLDALEHAKAYKNDSQIVKLDVEKRYSKNNASCLVEITELESSIYDND